MRVVALIQTYNERRFVARCIEHLREQGVDVYVIDNDSTDGTVEIVERYVGNGVIGLESMPRAGCFDLRRQLERKAELAGSLDADWFIHLDPDEFRFSADPHQSLAEALRVADESGFNAANFLEFTFVPTIEHPDHDHLEFERTMRWYYPFVPEYPHRLTAWKRQDGPVDLTATGGHRVAFPGLRMAPRNLYLRHYLFLSRAHLREKYLLGRAVLLPCAPSGPFSSKERWWDGWDAGQDVAQIPLPSEQVLRRHVPGELFDRSEPVRTRLWFCKPQMDLAARR